MRMDGRMRVFRMSEAGREKLIYKLGGGRGGCVLTAQCLASGGGFPAQSVVEDRIELAALPADAYRTLVANSSLSPLSNSVWREVCRSRLTGRGLSRSRTSGPPPTSEAWARWPVASSGSGWTPVWSSCGAGRSRSSIERARLQPVTLAACSPADCIWAGAVTLAGRRMPGRRTDAFAAAPSALLERCAPVPSAASRDLQASWPNLGSQRPALCPSVLWGLRPPLTVSHRQGRA